MRDKLLPVDYLTRLELPILARGEAGGGRALSSVLAAVREALESESTQTT
jgi:hypothetical protein